MSFLKVNKLNEQLFNKSSEEIVAHFTTHFSGDIALSTSLSAEDQVLTHMLLQYSKNEKIFTLDTGRLHPETYDVIDATNYKYDIKIEPYFPDQRAIEQLYKDQGINGFYESIENRKRCCQVRKIEPLKRALAGSKVWFTGLRRSQSITRADMQFVEYDASFDIIKVNPLLAWSERDIWNYIYANIIPFNKLHEQGYPSIGCAPCTRAIKEGEDVRAGRWWWEEPEHKECGLHFKEKTK